jgi:hypothetical protein
MTIWMHPIMNSLGLGPDHRLFEEKELSNHRFVKPKLNRKSVLSNTGKEV